MEHAPRIHEKIQAYMDSASGAHNRERSWEYCFHYFRRSTPDASSVDLDHGALYLGFYLASWGMYRGSGFLYKYTYTIHREVIDQLLAPRFSVLSEHEFGADDSDLRLVPTILEASKTIREAYRPYATSAGSNQATDMLLGKILLGTFGCIPACDTNFKRGLKDAGFRYTALNPQFGKQILEWCTRFSDTLREEQLRIEKINGVRYPLMKLVDMYFWQIGFEISERA